MKSWKYASEIKVRRAVERAVVDGSPCGLETVLTVSDTGSGVDPAFQKEIFNPFFTTKGQVKGTGLGLYIVNSIVKQHRGVVVVSSEPGKGTIFTVRIPAAVDLSGNKEWLPPVVAITTPMPQALERPFIILTLCETRNISRERSRHSVARTNGVDRTIVSKHPETF